MIKLIKVKSQKTIYLNKLFLGLRVYNIELGKDGYEIKHDDLAQAASSFNNIYISGEEPLNQMKELSELCKNIQKVNPSSTIFIETKGTVKPVGMTSIKNAVYIIDMQMETSFFIDNKKINDKALEWFNKAGAKFIFKLEHDDNLADIQTFINGMEIKKSYAYINIQTDNFKKTTFNVFNCGYNIYLEYDGVWFDGTK